MPRGMNSFCRVARRRAIPMAASTPTRPVVAWSGRDPRDGSTSWTSPLLMEYIVGGLAAAAFGARLPRIFRATAVWSLGIP
jgi:hypothetical protein